jgi:arabinogalactan endo-1,4-beta-galactosidase
MTKNVIILLWMVLGACSKIPESNLKPVDFYRGVDISILPKLEKYGAVYKANNVPMDALQIFRKHGINCIRLRLFHTPNDSGPVCNSLNYTLEFARRIKAAGFKFLLDFHYSDTWADPGKQYPPSAWKNLSYGELEDSVYQYTLYVIRRFKNQQTLPEIVQIGNEISNGMLWNMGRVSGNFENEKQWQNFGGLVKAGIRGVQDCLEPNQYIPILIHFDEGSSKEKNQWFFDHLFAQGVECDFIGVSYYPMWHGSMKGLEENLNFLSGRYQKDLFVVETGYPWTADPNQPLDTKRYTYPLTPEGQQKFLTVLLEIVKNVSGKRGRGLFYWAPEWIHLQGWGVPQWSPIFERMALFDYYGNALPALDVFKN